MTRKIYRIPVILLVVIAGCTIVQPALAQGVPTGSASNADLTGWTPAAIIAIIAAIGSTAISIIGALRGSSAQAKADSNEQRLNAVSNRLNAHGQQLTDLATNSLPPAMLSQIPGPPRPYYPQAVLPCQRDTNDQPRE